MGLLQLQVHEEAGRRVGVANVVAEEVASPHMTGELKVEALRFINRERPDVCIINWAGVQHAGTDSFGVMLVLQKRLADWQGELRLCGMNPLLTDSFTQCGLVRLIPLYDDVASARGGGKPA